MKRLLSLCIIFICAYTGVYAQCTVPTSVTINGPATISLCEGASLTLSGSVLVPGASQNTSFRYSWKKNVSGSTVDLVASTDIVIPANTTENVPNYKGITGTLADAGTYVLRVEDGNAGNASCYTEASVVVTVNPKPVITSVTTGTTCSGASQNYQITSSVPSTYIWARATVTGITSSARVSTDNPITETLTTITSATSIVRYVITPTSTTGSCAGTAFNYDVTVNPPTMITSAATGTICSGTAQNYEITSNVPSSYYWTRAVVVNIGPNTPGSGTSTPITEILTNTTATPIIVRYVITPTSTAGSCVGTPFNYDVTIANEIPPVVSISTNPGTTICTGTSATFKATPTNGGTSPTYYWLSSINGILASTTDTYTSNGLVDGEVIAASITSNLSCAMPKNATNSITMHVLSELIPSVSISADKTTICEGNPVSFFASSKNILSNALYEWFIESNGNQISQGAPSLYGSFMTSALKPNNTVLVKMISNDACANPSTAFSNSLGIVVSPDISAGTIGRDQTICYGAIPEALTELTASDAPIPIYTWQYRTGSNPTWYETPSSHSVSYVPTNSYTSDVYFRRMVTDGSIPTTCYIATTNEVHITISPSCVFSFSTSITGNSQITPGQQNVSYSVQNQAGISYAWSIIGGTIISGQGTNAIIVNWDGSPIGIAMARTTVPSYAISVTETNQANESKTTTMELNTTTTAMTTSLAQSGIQFYPNPSTDAFNIVMPQSGTLVQYNITDLSGMSVASGTFTSSGGAEKIPMNFNTGLYQVVLTYNETVTCLRLNKVQ